MANTSPAEKAGRNGGGRQREFRFMYCKAVWLEGAAPARIDKTAAELGSLEQEITVLTAHPSSDLLLAGQANGEIVVFDPTQATVLNRLAAHAQAVTQILFAADGLRFLTASGDGNVRLWDGQCQELLSLLVGDPVLALGLSHDASKAATGGQDKILRIWDLQSGELLLATPPLSEIITACTWLSPKALVVADSAGYVWVIDPASGRLLRKNHAHEQHISRVIGANSRAWYVTASWDRTIRVWNLHHKEKFSLPAGSEAVTDLALTADDKYLFAAYWDGNVRVWDTQTGLTHDEFTGSPSPLTACTVLGGPNYFVSADEAGTLRGWNLKEMGAPQYIHRHGGEVYDVVYTLDNVQAISVGWDGHLKVWDRNERVEAGYVHIHDHPVTSCTVSADNATWVVGSADGTVKVWNVLQKTFQNSFQPHKASVSAVRILPSGEHLISASWDMKLRLTSLRTHLIETTFDGHNKEVSSCDVSLDARRLISSSLDGTARIWSLEKFPESANALLVLEGRDGPLTCCAFSPDGKSAATGSVSGKVQLWNLDRPGEPHVLTGHHDVVTVCRFTPDGVVLVSADRSGLILFWDPATWIQLGSLTHEAGVLALAVAPDGAQAVVGDDMGGVRFLNLDYPAGPVWIAASTAYRPQPLWRRGTPATEFYPSLCLYCGKVEEHARASLGEVWRCGKCHSVMRLCPKAQRAFG